VEQTALHGLSQSAPTLQPSSEPGADKSFKLNAPPEHNKLQSRDSEEMEDSIPTATAIKFPSIDVDLTLSLHKLAEPKS
jgi:hypothetical protein